MRARNFSLSILPQHEHQSPHTTGSTAKAQHPEISSPWHRKLSRFGLTQHVHWQQCSLCYTQYSTDDRFWPKYLMVMRRICTFVVSREYLRVLYLSSMHVVYGAHLRIKIILFIYVVLYRAVYHVFFIL